MTAAVFPIDRLAAIWRNAFRPPTRRTVSEWAEANLTLDEKNSAFPGKLNLDRSPYLREPMNAVADRSIEWITLCFGAQLGKTTLQNAILGYAIDEDPGPTLLAMATLDLAKYVSKNRIDPLVNECEALAEAKSKDRHAYKLLEKQFDRMTLFLVGANSAAGLASRPIRYALLDEADKYPLASGDEAGAVELAVQRTKTFWNRKIILVSTPTVSTRQTWQNFLAGDQRYYYVPCPHCGHMQKLVTSQVRWPDDAALPKGESDGVGWDLDRVRDGAWYECESCHGRIEDRHKQAMLLAGEWRPTRKSRRRRSYQLASIYALWVTFGQYAAGYLGSRPFEEKYRDFVNSEEGLPFEEAGTACTTDTILCHVGGYEENSSPEEPLEVVVTADVQEDSLYYVVRAWCEHETSYLLRYGQIPTLQSLLDVAAYRYRGPSGDLTAMQGFIDSGDQTQDVYDFCVTSGFVPTKGFDRARLNQLYKFTRLESGIHLVSFQTDELKDKFARRLNVKLDDPSAWHLHRSTGQDYAHHMTSEKAVVRKDKWGRPQRVWIPVHNANHWFDCEILQFLAAVVLGVRNRRLEKAPPKEVIQPGVKRSDGRDWHSRS